MRLTEGKQAVRGAGRHNTPVCTVRVRGSGRRVRVLRVRDVMRLADGQLLLSSRAATADEPRKTGVRE